MVIEFVNEIGFEYVTPRNDENKLKLLLLLITHAANVSTFLRQKYFKNKV